MIEDSRRYCHVHGIRYESSCWQCEEQDRISRERLKKDLQIQVEAEKAVKEWDNA